MAKPSGSGGGDSRRSITNRFLEEASEIGLGVIMGQAASVAVREAIRPIFAGKTATDTADNNFIASTRESLRQKAKDAVKDEKLTSLMDEYVSNVVNIRASGRNEDEKELKLQQARKDYEAAVLKYKYEQSQQSYDVVLGSLTDEQRNVFTTWLHNSLSEEQREQILSRKKFIKNKKLIEDTIEVGLTQMGAADIATLYTQWGYVAASPEWAEAWGRASHAMYDYLVSALPKVPIKDQLGSAFEAILGGKGGEHPVVKAVEKSLKDNASERIRRARERLAKHRGR